MGSPIVPVMKSNGSVRICGDYKLTANRVAQLDGYPLPSIEDLFARLAGGKKFTKLDIAHVINKFPWMQNLEIACQLTPTRVCSGTTDNPLECTQLLSFFNVPWKVC